MLEGKQTLQYSTEFLFLCCSRNSYKGKTPNVNYSWRTAPL